MIKSVSLSFCVGLHTGIFVAAGRSLWCVAAAVTPFLGTSLLPLLANPEKVLIKTHQHHTLKSMTVHVSARDISAHCEYDSGRPSNRISDSVIVSIIVPTMRQ